MDHKPFVDRHIKQGLNEAFGAAMATMIFATASNKAGVPIMGIDREQYEALVEAVIGDARVIDTWGANGCEDRRREWMALSG